MRSNNNDINKGIGYHLLEPLPLSDEREELLLLLVLPEEERLSACPLETLLRLERLLLLTELGVLLLLRVELEPPLFRTELELLLLRVEPELLRLLRSVVLLLRLVLLRPARLSLRLLEFSIELLFARLLSRLEPEVVVLPVDGLRTELEFISGRR